MMKIHHDDENSSLLMILHHIISIYLIIVLLILAIQVMQKVKMVGKLVESCLDERTIAPRSKSFMAKRTLMINSVAKFANYSPEQQKKNLIR